MIKLPSLRPGDTVEIIAPASSCTVQQLCDLKALLESWQLSCVIADDIFGQDLLCANTDENRFNHLKKALLNPQTKGIICARGGYGSMRLIPALTTLTAPQSPKIFVGMSDTTALQLYIQQQWLWPTIHAGVLIDNYSPESFTALKSILFKTRNTLKWSRLIPLNGTAIKEQRLSSTLIGGNLSLIQAGIGTAWQLNGREKIIFIEEVGERAYRIDRMLEHLTQAKIFKEAAAILFGDFIGGNEPNGSSLIQPVLHRFAKEQDQWNIPVLQIEGMGHGYINHPLPLGVDTLLELGKEFTLTVSY